MSDLMNYTITIIVPLSVMAGTKRLGFPFLKRGAMTNLFFDLGVTGIIYTILTILFGFKTAFLQFEYDKDQEILMNLAFAVFFFLCFGVTFLFSERSVKR